MKLLRLLLLTIFTLPITTSWGQVSIGNGSSTGQNIPIEFYYGYTYSQTIYLSTDINTSGDITGLEWTYTGTVHADDIVIYMGNTTKTTFTSGSNWVAIGDLTQVFSGNVSFSPGTISITFDTPFYYDGIDNLVIAVDENTSSWRNNSDEFYCTTVGVASRSITYYNDNINPNPSSPPSTGTVKNAIPNVTLNISAATCPQPSTLTASSITTTAVDLSWVENGTATTWEYVVQAQGTGAPAGSGTSTTSNPLSISSLTAQTDYEVYLRADCGSGDYSNWIGPLNFSTACASIASFNENFDAVSTPDLPTCWSAIEEVSSASSFVRTVSSNANSASNSVTMYSSYGDLSSENLILVSPIVSNLSAGTHRLRFYAKNSNSALDIEVGTITDPADGSTFTSLQTVDIATTYAEYAVDFSAYAGSDNYIAIRRLIPYSTTYDYVYLDDIVWETTPAGAPSCSSITTPSNGSTGISITSNISWNLNIDATGYKLQIGTTNGGSEFLALTDVGNVTTYNPANEFEYDKTYYVTLIPYNVNGDAVACSSTSFTTTSGCRTASTPANSAAGVSLSSSVSWSSLSGASGYKISIGTVAGGTDILNAYDNSTATSYDMSNVSLSYLTTYYITIAAYNAQNELAIGCASTSFTTEADPTVTAPWLEDFESHSTTTNSSISTNSWSSNPSGTTGSFRWDIDGFGSTPSSSTGPSGAYSGSKYLYTEASSGSSGAVATLTSPPIDVSGLTGTPTLSFYYHMYGSDMGTLSVDIHDGTSWNTAVWTLSGQQQTTSTDAWLEATVDLSSYSGSGTIQVRFSGERGSDYRGDMSIDDVEVKGVATDDVAVTTVTPPASSCGLSNSESVTVTISNEGAGTIAVGAVSVSLTGANNTPASVTNTGTIASGATEDIVITGVDLSAVQAYTLTATATMTGDGVLANNSNTGSVTNISAIATYPFTEDFESGDGGWTSGGTNSSWALGLPSDTEINSAASGSNAWVTNLSGNYNDNENSYVLSPCFDFSVLSNPKVTLSIYTETENSWDGALLQYSLDGGGTWTTIGDANSGVNWYNDGTVNGLNWADSEQDGWTGIATSAWATAEYDIWDLGGESSIIFRVAFGSDGGSNDDGFAFDDFHIEDVPCPSPSSMSTTLISSKTADLAWTENGSATTWNLEWKAGADFTAGNSEEDGSATPTSNSTYSLTGLTETTTYYVYYQSDCGGSNSSWIGPFTFTTTVACPVPSAMTTSSVAATSADLSWSAGATETSWNLEWKAGADFTPGNSEEDNSTTANSNVSYTISSLTASTTYYVYYQADCTTDGTSSWVGPYSFSTTCATVTTFSENFDASLSIPDCWDKDGSTSDSKVSSTQANSGSNSWYLYNANYNSVGIYSQDVSTLGGNYRLSFSAYSTSASTRTLVVGTVDDLGNFTQFTSVQLVAQNTWEDFVIDYSAYAGTDTRLAIKHGQAAQYQVFYIDDIAWEEILADDAEVASITTPSDAACLSDNETIIVTIENKGYNNISIGDASVVISGDATSSAVTNTGTIAAGATEDISLTVDLSTVQLYNLTATVTLVGDGNAANDALSTSVSKVDADNSVGYTESFPTNTAPTGWNTTGWSFSNTHDNGNGDYGLFVNGYNLNVTDSFTTSTIGNIAAGSEFRFDYRIVNYTSYPNNATSGDFGNVQVSISTDCGVSYTLLETIAQGNHTETTDWATKTYDLSSYAGSVLKVKITNNWTSGDWFLDIDDVTFSSTPLPVELTHFSATAEHNYNMLQWETASEESNEYFEVQRSDNGIHFEVIGRVEGNGTTIETSNYEFMDRNPLQQSYYRLRQVDFGGSYEFSKIVHVAREVVNDEINIFPIPVRNELTVQYHRASYEKVEVYVLDLSGKIVKHSIVNQGENEIKINVEDLPEGSYLLRLTSKNSTITHRFIKQ